MASMVVLATTAVPDHLRGALSRWMIEVTPGMFVGTLSAKVRDELWTAASAVVGDGAAVLVHPGVPFAAGTPGPTRTVRLYRMRRLTADQWPISRRRAPTPTPHRAG